MTGRIDKRGRERRATPSLSRVAIYSAVLWLPRVWAFLLGHIMNRNKVLLIAIAAVILSFCFPPTVSAEAKTFRERLNGCFSCHGIQGISKNPSIPNLAGQVSGYIFRQLMAIKQGSTFNSLIMAGAVAEMDAQTMREFDAFFSALPPENPSVTLNEADLNLAREGQELYRADSTKGSNDTCAGCHGHDGAGREPDQPRVAGQKLDYLIGQLRAYKVGVRRHEAMISATTRLSDRDIRAVSLYMAYMGTN